MNRLFLCGAAMLSASCLLSVNEVICKADADCGPGYSCLKGQCYAGAPGGGGSGGSGAGGGAGGSSGGGGTDGGRRDGGMDGGGGMGGAGGTGGDGGIRCNGCTIFGGTCILVPTQSDFFCGSDGGVCAPCSNGQQCIQGSCRPRPTNCSPQNCTGCCAGTTCIQTPTNSQCGLLGSSCFSCPSQTTCSRGLCVASTTDGGVPMADGGLLVLGDAGSLGRPCTGMGCAAPFPFCIVESAPIVGNTGYTGGYCSAQCGATTACPAPGLCVTEILFGIAASSCKLPCAPVGTQGNCRFGYRCNVFDAGLGWCGPP